MVANREPGGRLQGPGHLAPRRRAGRPPRPRPPGAHPELRGGGGGGVGGHRPGDLRARPRRGDGPGARTGPGHLGHRRGGGLVGGRPRREHLRASAPLGRDGTRGGGSLGRGPPGLSAGPHLGRQPARLARPGRALVRSRGVDRGGAGVAPRSRRCRSLPGRLWPRGQLLGQGGGRDRPVQLRAVVAPIGQEWLVIGVLPA